MPGAYTLSESAGPAFYTAGSWSCQGGSLSGSVVTLGLGDDAVCTINNDDEAVLGPSGSLTIVKVTVPAGGTGFSFDAAALGAFSLDDGGSTVFTELAAGVYTVTETEVEGWAFNNVQCTATNWEASGPSVTVNLAEGEAAICTFTNGGLPYTGSQPFMLPLLIAGLWSVLMGLAMLVMSSMRKADTY